MNAKPNLDTYLNLCTEYYDLDKPDAPQDALDFYSQYVQLAKASILEPMCGTGRFLIPMLEKELDIEGFDASAFMLDRLRQKCVTKNLHPKIWKGFLHELKEKNKYDLVFIPSGSFGLIIESDQAKICLKKIFDALLDDGIFVFEAETLNAIPQQLNIWKGSVRKRPDNKSIILSTLDLPPIDNVVTTICRYDLVDGHAVINTEIENFRVRLYEPELLCNILKDVGFTTIKMIKAFDHTKEPGSNDEVIIYECRK